MTSLQTTRFRPDTLVFKDLAWRASLVVLATVGVLVGVPAWARAPLSIAAAVVTIMFFLRRRRSRGLIDSILSAIAILVVLLALLGLVLGVLPAGISAVSWGVGVGIIELAALFALAYWRAPTTVTRRVPRLRVATLVWTILVTGVLAGALIWSIGSFTSTHVAPLALGAVSSGGSVVVTISSGSDDGPYDLLLVTSTGRQLLARDIRVSAESPASITLVLPKHSREKVQLSHAGSTTSLRELILDTTTATTKVTR
jgi:hypothetical protein